MSKATELADELHKLSRFSTAVLPAAAELRRLDRVNAELVKALEWAVNSGRLEYTQRLKQNAAWCDGVDMCRAALNSSGEAEQ